MNILDVDKLFSMIRFLELRIPDFYVSEIHKLKTIKQQYTNDIFINKFREYIQNIKEPEYFINIKKLILILKKNIYSQENNKFIKLFRILGKCKKELQRHE